MQIEGSQNSPTSGVVNAKWHAETSTRVSINLNQKSMHYKSCREHKHIGAGKEVVRKVNVAKPVVPYTKKIL